MHVYTQCVQYTIRGVPSAVYAALRRRARAGGKSLNEAAVDALTEGAGMTRQRRKCRDLSDIAGPGRTTKLLRWCSLIRIAWIKICAVRVAGDTNGHVNLCKRSTSVEDVVAQSLVALVHSG